MFKRKYTKQELGELVANTAKRSGWDFSFMKTQSQPAPWDYIKIAALYLKPTDTVLDVGTGGGERFIKLSKHFKSGVGVDIDPEMIAVAKLNAKEKEINNIAFYHDSEKLENTPEIFNVIICRHAPFDLKVFFNEHLEKGGYYINQEVGEKNMLNIKKILKQDYSTPVVAKKDVTQTGFKLLAFMEYDIEYIVKDIESLVFWLNALDLMHADLEGGKLLANIELFNMLLEGNVDNRGFVTNEHRYLLIAQK